MIVECLNCGSTQQLNHSDGWQNCEHCQQVFPVPESVLRREAGEPEAPRIVTRGVVVQAPTVNIARSVENRSKSVVFLDYLSFTLPENSVDGYGHERIRAIARLLKDSLPEYSLYQRDVGLYGYTHSAEIYISGEGCGVIATGGNSGTTYVSLTGKATAWIDSQAWADWLDLVGARLSRVDLAHDDFDGKHTVDEVREAYLSGAFKNRGQNPSSSPVGPWDDPTKWGFGRTYYVGKRENGRMLRAYEKGKQLGDEASPWVRFEVEFRRTKDKPLVTDMLRDMKGYFLGSYRYLEWVSRAVAKKLDRVKEEMKLSFHALVDYARTAYGKLIHVMLTVYDDAPLIVDMLKVEGVPKRLQSATLPT
jgi:phage replication initiation protein